MDGSGLTVGSIVSKALVGLVVRPSPPVGELLGTIDGNGLTVGSIVSNALVGLVVRPVGEALGVGSLGVGSLVGLALGVGVGSLSSLVGLVLGVALGFQ